VGDFAERFVEKDGGIQQPAGHFCWQCGNRVNPSDLFCGQCGARLDVRGDAAEPTPATSPAPAASSYKEPILKAIEQELSKYPGLSISRSDKTDLEIKSVLADANWGVGKKKVEYSACLLAKDEERTVMFWEMIKETGSGMDFGGGVKTETFKSGKTLFGKVKEVQYGPDGKVIDYVWDYGKTRSVIEQAVMNSGWKFKTVLMKSKAMY
jgi:hypothetical protein